MGKQDIIDKINKLQTEIDELNEKLDRIYIKEFKDRNNEALGKFFHYTDSFNDTVVISFVKGLDEEFKAYPSGLKITFDINELSICKSEIIDINNSVEIPKSKFLSEFYSIIDSILGVVVNDVGGNSE